MEMPVVAPVAGRVRSVLVTANVQVDAGSAAARDSSRRMAKSPRRPSATGGSTWSSAGLEARRRPPTPCPDAAETLRRLVLGLRRRRRDDVRRRSPRAGRGAANDADRRRAEDELLAHLRRPPGLFAPRRATDDPEEQEWPSAQEYFLSYLRTLERSERPADVVPGAAPRALAHYGVDGLERSARARREPGSASTVPSSACEQQVPLITAILERRLEAAPR